jgi:hypothetical protein
LGGRAPAGGGRGESCYTGAVHHLDLLDIVAILLGIMFTIAKLDAQGRKASDFPHVAEQDFERWRASTTSIYRLGSAACFLRVLFHQGYALWVSRQPMTGPVFTDNGQKVQALPPALMYPGMIMDALFLGIIAVTFIRANRARALRRELNIVLSPMSPQQASAHEDEPTTKGD